MQGIIWVYFILNKKLESQSILRKLVAICSHVRMSRSLVKLVYLFQCWPDNTPIKYFTLSHMLFLCKGMCCRDILDQGIYTNKLLLQAKLFSRFCPLGVHFYV
jgi:hypothetical protein